MLGLIQRETIETEIGRGSGYLAARHPIRYLYDFEMTAAVSRSGLAG